MEYYVPVETTVVTEYVYKADQYLEHRSKDDKFKEQVFTAMKKLEGWCSEEKASVLIDLIKEKQPQTIVEIGVFGGKSLVPMAFALQRNGFGAIYGVDPWTEVASEKGMEGAHKDWWGSINHNKILNDLQDRIIEFGLEHTIELLRYTSIDCPEIYDIDILHIDGNHSEEASYIDVTKWVPLVKSGGVIIFDDLDWVSTGKAIAWLDENCVKVQEFKGSNIWAIWVKP
jgi:predicted O-methyltransferase YrrM